MNKKIEHLITAGMIAALVAVFFYQVAYGITMPYSNGYWARFKPGKADGIHKYVLVVDKPNLTSQQQSRCDQGYS